LTGIRALDRLARSLVAVLSMHSPCDDTSCSVTQDIHPVYETKSSLKRLEEPITSLSKKPVHTILPYFLYIQFQPLPSLPRPYKYLITFRFSDQTLYEFCTSVHTISPPSYPSLFEPNKFGAQYKLRSSPSSKHAN